MGLREHTALIEYSALGPIVLWPDEHPWELQALDARLFSHDALWLIAAEVCALRDAGRRVHWKRVRRGATKRAGGIGSPSGDGVYQLVTLMKRQLGCSGNMDYWMAELRRLAAERGRRK